VTPASVPQAARVSAIVLAGGRSSRFGSDKLATDLDGMPLLHHALKAAASACDELVVVAGRAGLSVPLPVATASATRVVSDIADHPGPLVAIGSGARAAVARRLLVVGGDMPSLQPAVLARLVAWPAPHQGACLVLAGAPQPLPLAVERDACVAAIASLVAAGRRSLRDLVASLDIERVPETEWRSIDPDALSLRDVDVPGDVGLTT
jgi:molybdopterin-guanine dinucleotide biosynthesis protein A